MSESKHTSVDDPVDDFADVEFCVSYLQSLAELEPSAKISAGIMRVADLLQKKAQERAALLAACEAALEYINEFNDYQECAPQQQLIAATAKATKGE